ncbi:peptide transport system ATP-binding protein [Actinobacillus equuli]|nr:peptide transport system ATP-binding protein [Actinobacillus equuli]
MLANPQHPYTKALIAADPKHWQAVENSQILQKSTACIGENLSVARGKRTLFSELSFDLHQGEILGVVGHSGIGKSTLADVLCGLLKPKSGEVIWHSQQHKNIRY